ncbi:MAG: glycine--tRNA ligase [Candidatus Pacebacteria bacterium]|nr:glycine--tRNA ligase [Candidatus Paceibacterota bacterium]
MPNPQPSLDQITALCKRRGFIFPTSEIYGGLHNCYDYGPLGAVLLRNIRNLWWDEFITKRDDMVGLDSQIILHPQTWVSSGHVTAFTDPLVEDKVTHKRYRADHLIEAWLAKHAEEPKWQDFVVENLDNEQMAEFIKKHSIKSPEGNEVTEPKDFNILFESAIGAVTGEKSKVYLRGETAQGIFTNFKQVVDSTRVKLPFGIGQIGKSFRNEITTGQFTFRTLEFEQAEIEYFFDPEQQDWQQLFKQWQTQMWKFVNETLGVDADNLRWRQHTDQERSHYSKDTYDLDYRYSFGWKELWGIAYRTNYDLKQHSKHADQNLEYIDPQTNKKFFPHAIEPAVGVNRLALMVLTDAYWQDTANKRTVLKLKPNLAPYQVAVFPLLKNKPKLVEQAKTVYDHLKNHLAATWDERGNIGKRYLYQDEIGTPFCITIDFDTLDDESVTVRDRDTTKQERVKISQLEKYFQTKLG